jgi:hypothetical protein
MDEEERSKTFLAAGFLILLVIVQMIRPFRL